MNCQAVQNKILALPDPRHVPDPLRAHVAGCAGCRVWAEQAARIEGLLERLPVPPAPADKKITLIGDLTRPVVEPVRRFGSVAEFFRRNAALVGGLAAAVAVAAGGWWLAGRSDRPTVATQPAPTHPFLETVVRRNVALARAETPAKRLQVLGGYAEDLSAQARGLARVASPDELKDVARWFDKVVNEGLVRQAGKLPAHALTPAERLAELDALAGKLGGAADEVEKLTGEVAPDAKPALQQIAKTARDGQQQLRALAAKGVLTVARVALLLAASAALAAWAGAQGPPPPLSAADRLRMLKADRNLLENLVGHGIDLSAADDPLRRAEECRKTARTLANSLARAAEDRNGDRVAELADLMGEVVRDGLAPNLEEAAATIPANSPEAKRLHELREKTAADLDEVGAAVPAGDHRRARAALDRLAALKTQIKK